LPQGWETTNPEYSLAILEISQRGETALNVKPKLFKFLRKGSFA
jgi:hypothetical protein